MLLETEKNNICINQIIGQKKENAIVEEDIIVNDVKPDVLNIISTNGIISVYKKEVMDGKIKLDGTINTYIMYLADTEEGNIRSLNTTLDFSQTINIENCKEGMDLEESATITKFECKVTNSRKINIKAYIELEGKVYSTSNIDFITNINNSEDMQVLSSNKRVNSLLNKGFSKTYAKDNIAIQEPDELAEVMSANIQIINKENKISYNKILAKADVKMEVMYLTEDNRINSITTTIPIMGFIDMENINEDNVCNVQYKLKNFILKPNNNEANSLYVEAEIELSCIAYETKDINIIEDLYSITSDIEFQQNDIYTMCGKENVTSVYDLSEKIETPEINENRIYNVRTNPIINSQNIRNGKIIYQGDAVLEILYGNDRTVNIKEVKIPFTFEVVSNQIDDNSKVETYIDVKNSNVLLNGVTLEVKIELEFNTSISKNQKINVINEISLEEHRQDDLYSMVIYFVKPGDTLWKIAKKFRSTVDDIVRINGIEDENKIYPKQQLYIPKYIKRNVAV